MALRETRKLPNALTKVREEKMVTIPRMAKTRETGGSMRNTSAIIRKKKTQPTEDLKIALIVFGNDSKVSLEYTRKFSSNIAISTVPNRKWPV